MTGAVAFTTARRKRLRKMAGGAPIGIALVEKCCDPRNRMSRNKKDFWYKIFILIFTFLCYTTYHLSRKPLSVVKNVLSRNCSEVPVPPGTELTNETKNTWCEWAPFNEANSDELLGTLDSAFLFSYAFAMFFSGVVAERVNLRYFLALGMLLSGVFTYLFGIAYTYGIHQLWYFIFVQAIGGIVQSTGWPSVVTCIGNWFGKGRRGLIFGIWNSHTSVGNILGSLIAGAYVDNNWGLSFILPGAIIGAMGFIVFLFLVPYPDDVGCTPPDHHSNKDLPSLPPNASRHLAKSHKSDPDNSDADESDLLPYDDAGASDGVEFGSERASSFNRHPRKYYDTSHYSALQYQMTDEERPILVDENGVDHLQQHKSHEHVKAISFSQALKIPGVIEFSLCLFFAKLVSYTFLYWLPRYISFSTSMSASDAANLSTLFDVGGIIGGILAGIVSDHTGASAATCTVMLFLAIPLLFIYQAFGGISFAMNIALLMLVGLMVNGPYALITTAVSAELGTHKSLRGNSKALATVASIIDGTGSLGAAVGPLLAGLIAASGWSNVFYMLMGADVFAMLLLLRLAKKEINRLLRQWRDKRHHQYAQ